MSRPKPHTLKYYAANGQTFAFDCTTKVWSELVASNARFFKANAPCPDPSSTFGEDWTDVEIYYHRKRSRSASAIAGNNISGVGGDNRIVDDPV